ncbi:MAG: hypothetical protein ACTSPQ_12230 [Candidatus Helarchaeota archaeon]
MKFLTYTDVNNGFELLYPSDWMVDDHLETPGVAFIAMHDEKEKRFHEMASIFVEPFIEKPKKFFIYIKRGLTRLNSLFKQFKIIEKLKKVNLKGIPCYTLKGKSYISPYNIIIKFYWILHEKKSYAIQFIAEESNFNAFLPIFNKMINSLVFFSPGFMTKDIEMQKNQRKILSSIDVKRVSMDINKINENTSIEVIHNLIEIFSLASIMVDTKGFGILNHLYPKFREKLDKTRLIEKIPEDMYFVIKTFDDIAKSYGLIK